MWENLELEPWSPDFSVLPTVSVACGHDDFSYFSCSLFLLFHNAKLGFVEVENSEVR